MSSRRRAPRRRSSLLPTVLGGALALSLAVAGAWAWSEGHLAAIGLEPRTVQAEDSAWLEPGLGEVAVILASQPIPQYTKVRREHLLLPGELRLATTIMPRENAEAAGLITDMSQILGRVLAEPKSAGYAFQESSFLPEGTRPGLVGGIPAGKRGLRVEASRLLGIAGLRPGDRFDLVAAFPVSEELASSNPVLDELVGPAGRSELARGDFAAQARVEVLVHGGLIVEPLTVRQVPVSSSSLTQGLQVQTKPVEELVIALAPEEVGSLLEAFALEVELTVLPRSGRPEDDPEARTPDHEPRLPSWMDGESGDGVRFIERYDGSERTLVPVSQR